MVKTFKNIKPIGKWNNHPIRCFHCGGDYDGITFGTNKYYEERKKGNGFVVKYKGKLRCVQCNIESGDDPVICEEKSRQVE